MGSLALGLTEESVITDSARREARAEEARGGDGEPKRVIFLEVGHCCGPGRGEKNRGQGGHLVHDSAEGSQAHSWPPGPS